MKDDSPKTSSARTPQLPPELQARLERMAKTNRQTVEQELSAAVTLSWVRHVGKAKGPW